MGIRGYEWGIYTDDLGVRWLMKVDADYFADPDRGWEARAIDDILYWPQGWLPRRVEGLDTEGNTLFTRVASLTAPLWTGETLSFVVNASAQEPVAVAVFRYWGERRRPQAPALP